MLRTPDVEMLHERLRCAVEEFKVLYLLVLLVAGGGGRSQNEGHLLEND